MKWLWQTIGCLSLIFIGIILGAFVLRELLKPGICEIKTLDSQKASVQTNNFYSRVFGDKRCAPKRIIFKVPVIQKLEQHSTEPKEIYSPEIITILTISNRSQSFYIKRIDESKKGFNVSTGNTCIAWKWLEKDKNQILSFSLQRNLQIHDATVNRIIFIVSLPSELQRAGTRLSLKRSVLKDSKNNQSGEVILENLNSISPNLSKLIESKDAHSNSYSGPSVEQHWAAGASVSKELSDELTIFTKRVGVYVDEPIKNIHDKSDDIEAYEKLPEKYSCEIPKDLDKV